MTNNSLTFIAPNDKLRAANNKRKLRPTEYLRSWIAQKVRKYAEQIGITAQETPNIVFTRREVFTMPKELTAGRRTVTHKCLGICFPRAKTILINVKKHTSYEDLKRTIVYELVHYRFRYLKHGVEFEKRISLIQRGKRYKVKVLYPENPLLSLSYKQNHEIQLQRILYRQQPCRKYLLTFDAEHGS
ncbi:MAG TPA: hypothetical protein VE130_00075 [Nitrososphaeraceae archaeon]|jgi:hypothetical protein|nr:hypothetical protein [Nitrososphaeraceae archaeon]